MSVVRSPLWGHREAIANLGLRIADLGRHRAKKPDDRGETTEGSKWNSEVGDQWKGQQAAEGWQFVIRYWLFVSRQFCPCELRTMICDLS